MIIADMTKAALNPTVAELIKARQKALPTQAAPWGFWGR